MRTVSANSGATEFIAQLLWNVIHIKVQTRLNHRKLADLEILS